MPLWLSLWLSHCCASCQLHQAQCLYEERVRSAVNDDIVFQVAAVFVFLPTLHNLFTGMAAIFGRGWKWFCGFQLVCVCVRIYSISDSWNSLQCSLTSDLLNALQTDCHPSPPRPKRGTAGCPGDGVNRRQQTGQSRRLRDGGQMRERRGLNR